MSKVHEFTDVTLSLGDAHDCRVHLLDFWAEWCSPCHALAPVLEELAEDFSESAVISKIDVSKFPDIGDRFAVRSVPTLLFFVKGEQVHRVVGAKRKSQLVRELTRLIEEGGL